MNVDLRSIIMEKLVPAIERISRGQFIVPNNGGKKPFGPIPSIGLKGSAANAYSMHPHQIKWVYGLSGKAELVLNGNRYVVEQGDLGFIPPNTPYLECAFERRQNFQLLWFCCFPQKNRITIHSTSYQGANHFQVLDEARIENRPDLAKSFIRTVDEVQARTRGWCSYLRANVNEVLLGTMRHIEQHGNGLTPVQKQKGMIEIARAYIQTNFMRPLTLKEISHEVFLSPNYFTTLFAKATGMTVFDYVQQVRLEESRRLLAETALPVRQVARQSGYHNVAHFTRTFKLQSGVTPRDFRKSTMGKSTPAVISSGVKNRKKAQV
jgi:AraC-like DNA-binding protein